MTNILEIYSNVIKLFVVSNVEFELSIIIFICVKFLIDNQ